LASNVIRGHNVQRARPNLSEYKTAWVRELGRVIFNYLAIHDYLAHIAYTDAALEHTSDCMRAKNKARGYHWNGPGL